MDQLREKAGIISAILLSIINGLAGLGVVLPTGADGEGVALANAPAVAIGALVVHFLKPKPTA